MVPERRWSQLLDEDMGAGRGLGVQQVLEAGRDRMQGPLDVPNGASETGVQEHTAERLLDPVNSDQRRTDGCIFYGNGFSCGPHAILARI